MYDCGLEIILLKELASNAHVMNQHVYRKYKLLH